TGARARHGERGRNLARRRAPRRSRANRVARNSARRPTRPRHRRRGQVVRRGLRQRRRERGLDHRLRTRSRSRARRPLPVAVVGLVVAATNLTIIRAVAAPQESPHEIAAFLVRHPPFEGLADAELEAIAATVARRDYRAGEAVLVEDGPPAE